MSSLLDHANHVERSFDGENQSKDLISQGSWSKKETLSNGQTILFICVPRLNLHVISDAINFGTHWISVNFAQNVYSTNYLLGGDSDTYSPVARFLAQKIIEKTFPNASPIELSMISKKMLINLSLRSFDKKILCEIADLI